MLAMMKGPRRKGAKFPMLRVCGTCSPKPSLLRIECLRWAMYSVRLQRNRCEENTVLGLAVLTVQGRGQIQPQRCQCTIQPTRGPSGGLRRGSPGKNRSERGRPGKAPFRDRVGSGVRGFPEEDSIAAMLGGGARGGRWLRRVSEPLGWRVRNEQKTGLGMPSRGVATGFGRLWTGPWRVLHCIAH